MPRKRAEDHEGTKAGDLPVARLRVRLPSFLVEDEVGLGDVIKRVTYAIGIKPCLGCEGRAAWLNKRLTFHR